MQSTKNELAELQAIISKMPIQVCCATAVPEFGVPWKEVSRMIRMSRLPMQPSSVARILCKHAAKSPPDELYVILGRLRLKLAAIQPRTWHVLHLQEPIRDEPITVLLRALPQRMLAALRNCKHGGMRPEVQSVMLGDLVYFSIQFVSATKQSSILYVATPPGQPVALVSFVSAGKILKACVEGLGYASYQNGGLHGRDIPSLLRIADPAWGANADHLTDTPAYQPSPVILPNGIDYTYKKYDEQYIDSIIGPNPPLLTNLVIKTTRAFFDRSRLNKPITMTMTLRSDDVARSLRVWATRGGIAPTSEFFHIFHKTKSNKIYNNRENSDSD